MPFTRYALMLLAVLFAAAVTVWLIAAGGPGLLVAAVPALLIAALAIQVLRR